MALILGAGVQGWRRPDDGEVGREGGARSGVRARGGDDRRAAGVDGRRARRPPRASSPAISSASRRSTGAVPALNAVIEVNPDALAIARELDRERKEKGARGPLHGIPVLIKDNIDTADRMETTAGSLALLGSQAGRRTRPSSGGCGRPAPSSSARPT
ncbi:MAG: amidase family protein [Sphingobacterium sp.]|nr:amidase family protein [Sphingobacterium sp.]